MNRELIPSLTRQVESQRVVFAKVPVKTLFRRQLWHGNLVQLFPGGVTKYRFVNKGEAARTRRSSRLVRSHPKRSIRKSINWQLSNPLNRKRFFLRRRKRIQMDRNKFVDSTGTRRGLNDNRPF